MADLCATTPTPSRARRVLPSCLPVLLCVGFCTLPAASQQVLDVHSLPELSLLPDHSVLVAHVSASSVSGPQPQAQLGSVSGAVTDVGGTSVSGAHVVLISDGSPAERETVTDAEGHFLLANVPVGTFLLTVTEEGLAPQSATGTVVPGGVAVVPTFALRVATASTSVEVTLSRHDLAEVELHQQETQRVIGIIPNFLVSYDPNAVALSSGQKFHVSSRIVFDPVSLGLHAITAGVQQADNAFPGYGDDAAGYGKRYGAALATSAAAVFFGDAIYPTLFHQDPRYFFKGTGTKKQRAIYAISSQVISRSDSGKRMPNYSKILGNLTAGALSNLYYPADSRHGVTLTLENGLLNTAAGGVGKLLQEFLWPHFTTNRPTHMQPKVVPPVIDQPRPAAASPGKP